MTTSKMIPGSATAENAFDNQPIRTVVVKNWQKEDVLYLIFHRLNSETLPLSPARTTRPGTSPGAIPPFRRRIYSSSSGYPQSARHSQTRLPHARCGAGSFVRYVAFQYSLDTYTGNLKTFLDDECKRLNSRWTTDESDIRHKAEHEAAINASYDIFGDNAFRKYDGHNYEIRFNRAVFDIPHLLLC